MRYEDGKAFEGMILWAASLTGPLAVPGKFTVRLTVGEEHQEQPVEILMDPRSESSIEDLQAQFDFTKAIVDKITEAHETIIEIRDIRAQIKAFNTRAKNDPEMKEIVALGEEIIKEMTAVEEELYQTQNQSNQDPLNFPIKLTNKLAHLNSLMGRGNYRPTKQAIEVQQDIEGKIDVQLESFEQIKVEKIPTFNQKVKEMTVDLIQTKKPIKP